MNGASRTQENARRTGLETEAANNPLKGVHASWTCACVQCTLHEMSATVRERLEQDELKAFSPFAQLSSKSAGRARPEAPCDLRPAFQHDRDKIIHAKSFRRLAGKTQVFLAPEGDHYRTRITHTL